MSDNNQNQGNLGEEENLSASEQQDNTATNETEETNKPQPNVILNKVSGGGSGATSYHDTERVSPRANEASDQKDTNTGGIVSGGAKGASQS